MSNKQGQPTRTGNQESQGNQPHQEETKRRNNEQQQQSGGATEQQGGGGKTGPQPGSQRDKNGRIG